MKYLLSLLVLLFSLTGFSAGWNTWNYSETLATNGTVRNFRLAVSSDFRHVRGIVVELPGSSADTRANYTQNWLEEFLRLHQFAFIGAEGLAVAPGASESLKVFSNSIPSFVTQSGKAEIAYAPLVFIGGSGGGSLSYNIITNNYSKVIAWVSMSGAVGVAPTIAPSTILDIPVVMIAGDSDVALVSSAMNDYIATNRIWGLRGAFAEIKGSDHPTTTEIHGIGMALLHEAIALSYPTNQNPLAPPVVLSRIPEADGWLIDTNTIRSAFPTVTNWSAYPGVKSKAHWVPNRNMAWVWRSQAAFNTNIWLSVPANYSEVSPGASITVTVNDSLFAGWTNMSIYSFGTNLANFTSGTATVTLNNVTPGLYMFSAIATRGGTNITTRPIQVLVRTTAAPNYPYIWYAANNGLSGNAGTIAAPWSLRAALTKTTTVLPGDTIYLRGGTYTEASPENVSAGFEGDVWQATISGGYGKHITIESYPTEWAVVDGGSYSNGINAFHASSRPTIKSGSSGDATVGRFLTWKNFELMSSSTAPRTSATLNCSTCTPPTNESFPEDYFRSDGFYVYGQSNILVNLVIHDVNVGISPWEQSSATWVHGCVVYNNGWVGVSQLHGHGMYTQNKINRENKVIGTNIFVNNYDNSIQAYGSGGAEVYHYRILGNIMYNNRLLVGGRTDTAEGDNQIRDNLQFNSDLVFIYHSSVNALDMQVANNYVGRGALQGGYWQTAIITNNTVVAPSTVQMFVFLSPPPFGAIPPGWTVDRNTYLGPGASGQYFNIDGVGPKNFPDWQAFTGWDANSTLASLPTTNKIVLQGNLYDTNRAHVAAYNWANSNSVALSLSTLGWSTSDSVRVRNAQDYFSDITTNSIPGNVLTVNMQAPSHTVALPIGSSTVTGPKSFPTFGGFVLERIPSAVATPTNIITIVSSPTGATINATTDLNGASSGTASFTRSYLNGTPITLSAAPMNGTNQFSKWTLSGVDVSFVTNISFNVSVNATYTAVYVAPPTTTWTFNISSSNPSGVTIAVTPLDNSGNGDGVSPFSRTFNDGTLVTMTAPTTVGGNSFQRWNRNGANYSTKNPLNQSADSATLGSNPATYEAVFVATASPTNVMVIHSINPNFGVSIVVSATDLNGDKDGVTSFTRVYNNATIIQVQAPPVAPNGNVFFEWQSEPGVPAVGSGSTNLFITSHPSTRYAVYTNSPLPTVSVGGASNRRRSLTR